MAGLIQNTSNVNQKKIRFFEELDRNRMCLILKKKPTTHVIESIKYVQA